MIVDRLVCFFLLYFFLFFRVGNKAAVSFQWTVSFIKRKKKHKEMEEELRELRDLVAQLRADNEKLRQEQNHAVPSSPIAGPSGIFSATH